MCCLDNPLGIRNVEFRAVSNEFLGFRIFLLFIRIIFANRLPIAKLTSDCEGFARLGANPLTVDKTCINEQRLVS